MLLKQFVFFVNDIGIAYFLAVNLFYIILISCCFPMIFRRYTESQFENMTSLLNSSSLPSVCIIVPMHNEEKLIVKSIKALLEISYPHFHIIVVNDGSTDRSLECVQEAFKTELMNGSIKLIDKKQGGKGDALNTGIRAAEDPLILTVDADTFLERDALSRMVIAFIRSPGVVAQGGTLRIVPDSLYLTSTQTVEYLRAFLYGRLGWNYLGGNLIVSGAFGLFDRAALLEVGGYIVGEVSEDIEITVKLTRLIREKHKKNAVQFIPDPVAWTKGPKTKGGLGRQRERWQRGLIDTIIRHKDILFNPKYGLTAFVGFPYLIFAEMVQPVIELIVSLAVIAGLILGVFHWEILFVFIAATWGVHCLLTLLALVLEMTTFQRYGKSKDLLRLGWFALIENIGFRQICMVWRVFAFYRYAIGYKKWH